MIKLIRKKPNQNQSELILVGPKLYKIIFLQKIRLLKHGTFYTYSNCPGTIINSCGKESYQIHPNMVRVIR
jgi:hypothetical protein